jgi:hypothetical protein
MTRNLDLNELLNVLEEMYNMGYRKVNIETLGEDNLKITGHDRHPELDITPEDLEQEFHTEEFPSDDYQDEEDSSDLTSKIV